MDHANKELVAMSVLMIVTIIACMMLGVSPALGAVLMIAAGGFVALSKLFLEPRFGERFTEVEGALIMMAAGLAIGAAVYLGLLPMVAVFGNFIADLVTTIFLYLIFALGAIALVLYLTKKGK